MDIPVANKNSLSYFLLSSSIILFLWTLSSLATYTIPYQVAVLLECRWLLASLLVTCFFTYLFVNIRSSVMFTVTYVSAQYCLAYSTVSTIICSINIHHVLINWSEDEQRDSIQYLKLTIILTFLSFSSIALNYYLLENLVKLASNSDQAMQKSERKMQMLICSLVHIILGGINLFSCYKFMKNIPFASSFIVQQICCTFSSLLIARMQWQFRDYINTYISRFIVIMNVCQLVQELTYAYSTFMMMMFVNNETNSLLLRFSSGLKNQVLRLLICNFFIHGIRLITCSYPIVIFSKMAFPSEIYDCIKFLPDQQRGITFQEANEEESKDRRQSKSLFLHAFILASVGIITDIVYTVLSDIRRIGNSGISLIYTKILAILSINILTSSSYSMYAFAESMLSGQLYEVVNRSNVAFIMNAIYFSLSLSFTMFSVRSIEFCFHTITKHTVQCDQSATVARLLKCFGYLAYAIIVIVCIEIIATIFTYGTRLDLVLKSEIHTWMNILSTCFLQLWISKLRRFQCCLLIIIIQLVTDCSTTILIILVQTNIVQTVITVILHQAKQNDSVFGHIFYNLVDHISQIIQWLLTVCSLSIALVVLDAMNMSEGEISNAIDNPGFFDEISPFRSENNNSFTNEQNNISCTVQYTSQNSANNSAQNEIEFVSNIEKCTMSEEEETDTVTGNRSNSSEVEKGICSVYNGNNYDSTVIFVVDNDDNGQVEIESSDNDHASLIPTIEDNIESTEKSQNYDSKSAEVRIDETDIREARENKEGNNNGDNHNGDPGVMIDDCDEIQIFKCEEASSREDNQNNSSSSLQAK